MADEEMLEKRVEKESLEEE
jgi:jmjN domain